MPSNTRLSNAAAMPSVVIGDNKHRPTTSGCAIEAARHRTFVDRQPTVEYVPEILTVIFSIGNSIGASSLEEETGLSASVLITQISCG